MSGLYYIEKEENEFKIIVKTNKAAVSKNIIRKFTNDYDNLIINLFVFNDNDTILEGVYFEYVTNMKKAAINDVMGKYPLLFPNNIGIGLTISDKNNRDFMSLDDGINLSFVAYTIKSVEKMKWLLHGLNFVEVYEKSEIRPPGYKNISMTVNQRRLVVQRRRLAEFIVENGLRIDSVDYIWQPQRIFVDFFTPSRHD
jgi:hypothetical protein